MNKQTKQIAKKLIIIKLNKIARERGFKNWVNMVSHKRTIQKEIKNLNKKLKELARDIEKLEKVVYRKGRLI